MRREDTHSVGLEQAAAFERHHAIEPLPHGWDIRADDVPSGPGEGCGHVELERGCLVCAWRVVFRGAS